VKGGSDTRHVAGNADGQITWGDLSPPLSSPQLQNFLIFRNDKSLYIRGRPVPLEGRLEIVTDAGQDAVAAGGAFDEGARMRTAKACGPDAPMLASSLRKHPQATVARKPVAGESAL
jgi:hypothetical protein